MSERVPLPSAIRARPPLLVAAAALALGAAVLVVIPAPDRAALAQVAADGRCPNQGRDPQTVVVPPTVSATYDTCHTSSQISGGGLSTGSSASDRCPHWTTTGLSYNPAMPKPGFEITRTQDMINEQREYRCRRSGYLWGLFSRTGCTLTATHEFGRQVTVLEDEPCAPPVVGGDPQ